MPGGSYRPLIVEMALSALNLLTRNLPAVNTLITEERLLPWWRPKIDQPGERPKWRPPGRRSVVMALAPSISSFKTR
jgi:hypothetical protein